MTELHREPTFVDGVGGVRLALDVVLPEGSPRVREPAFLLVHGLASNARLWDGVVGELGRGGFASGAMDLRGHGRSDKPDEGYDYDTMTADVAAAVSVLQEAAGTSRVVAVGQSYGGNLVVELAARRPGVVSGIACVDGGMIDAAARFGSFEEAEAALRPPAIAGMPASELEARMREMHPDWPEEGIAGSMANFELRRDGTVAPWLSFEHHMAILRAMFDSPPSAAYPKIAVPVLFLPAESPGAPTEWSQSKRAGVAEALELLPDARVRWFTPADHDVHAQHPVEVAAALVETFAAPGSPP